MGCAWADGHGVEGDHDLRRLDQADGPLAGTVVECRDPQVSDGSGELGSPGTLPGLSFLVEKTNEFVEETAGDVPFR